VRLIQAQYDNGVLRPAKPLPLRSGERVTVLVVRQPEPARWDLARLAGSPDEDDALAHTGLDDWANALEALGRVEPE
jgi:predicted DNA-binding antitoxin AbrB/MazE fold protein